MELTLWLSHQSLACWVASIVGLSGVAWQLPTLTQRHVLCGGTQTNTTDNKPIKSDKGSNWPWSPFSDMCVTNIVSATDTFISNDYLGFSKYMRTKLSTQLFCLCNQNFEDAIIMFQVSHTCESMGSWWRLQGGIGDNEDKLMKKKVWFTVQIAGLSAPISPQPLAYPTPILYNVALWDAFTWGQKVVIRRV